MTAQPANFRPTLFIAAVRAALGEASILHGVDEMPPKSGVTEEGILRALGAQTDLSFDKARTLIEDKSVGFAYLSQREYSPAAYNIRELRVHIKKRPPWAATEKAQQLFKAPGANYLIIGYYHPGYEEPLLNLAWERGFSSGTRRKRRGGIKPLHLAIRQAIRGRLYGCQLLARISGKSMDSARISRSTSILKPLDSTMSGTLEWIR